MKKIFGFLKKNRVTVGIVTIALVTLLLFKANNINIKRNAELLRKTELAELKAFITDSISISNSRIEIFKMDSLKAAEDIKIKEASHQAELFKAQAQKYKKNSSLLQSKIDTLLGKYEDSISGPCKEIVGIYKEQVFNLNFEIGALNGANNALEIKIGSLGKQLSFSNIQLVEKESIIVSKESLISAQKISNESLKKQLQKQNNFFNRNKFWIGAGLGVLGVLIVK